MYISRENAKVTYMLLGYVQIDFFTNFNFFSMVTLMQISHLFNT